MFSFVRVWHEVQLLDPSSSWWGRARGPGEIWDRASGAEATRKMNQARRDVPGFATRMVIWRYRALLRHMNTLLRSRPGFGKTGPSFSSNPAGDESDRPL